MDLLSKLKTITDLPTIPTTVVKVLRVAGSGSRQSHYRRPIARGEDSQGRQQRAV